MLPQNLPARRDAFNASLAAQVRQEDGTRPLADDSDIIAWSQSPLRDPRNQSAKDYDDGSRMAAQLPASSKPLLTKGNLCRVRRRGKSEPLLPDFL